MRNYVWALVLVLALVGCKAPDSVRDADLKAAESQAIAVANLNKLFFKSIEAYRAEATQRAMLFMSTLKARGASEEEAQAVFERLTEEIDAETAKVLQKYLEVKEQWALSLELREAVSEYLENHDRIAKFYNEFRAEVMKDK